ncbi:Serine carboxypeptidase-like 49, partial [Linum grandiflorum]
YHTLSSLLIPAFSSSHVTARHSPPPLPTNLFIPPLSFTVIIPHLTARYSILSHHPSPFPSPINHSLNLSSSTTDLQLQIKMLKSTASFKLPVTLLLLLSLLLCSSAAEEDYAELAKSNFPSVQAQKFIRDLNLFPKEDVNVVQAEASSGLVGDSPLTGKKIVEKRLKFPNLVGEEGKDGFAAAEDLGHHAGYYNIEHSHAAKMFYFFFESRNSKKDPVVIWLTGGPGCSSELAIFYENGPFSIANNMSLVWNKYGWDQASNLIYVDQPTGTGFSYSTDRRDLRHDEDGVSNDLYDFLQAFFKEHPELAKNDFYITGESYAGHYIPAFASRVHRGNKNNEGIHINFKGFAIGNGLTDPGVQYKAYPDYALENGIIKKAQYDKITKMIPVCETAIKLCGTDGSVSCMASYYVCTGIFNSIMSAAGGINYYDIRKQCEGSLCYDFSNMEKFLNLNTVRESLGVGDIDFVSCSPTVYEAMLMDWMKNLEVGIPALLEDGIKMLIYAGEYDLICNWLGNSRWVHSMEWSGQKKFGASPEISFEVDGSEAGVMKTHGPLTFLKVHNAGHMVPMDQPKAALEMLKKWTQGKLSDADESGPESLVAEF